MLCPNRLEQAGQTLAIKAKEILLEKNGDMIIFITMVSIRLFYLKIRLLI
jgi:hypothetical protein